MSINSVVNDLVTSVSVINALKPLPPTISGYSVAGKDDLALDPAGGQTVQINGTGFLPGATITFDGSAVSVVTYVNPNQLTFTSPAKTAGTYTIYAVNPDGGTAIYVPGIIYSTLPTWTTAAGSLGSYYETTSISNTVVAAGDAPVTYSLYSGSLPTGSTLSANGVITGTAPVDSSSTTYSFTIQASDAQLQDSTRSFSLTINVDAVTWVSPANNTTYTSAANSAISTVTLSATDAAGYAVSYSANALPTGLSLSGANITGTPTVVADSSTLLTATAATTNRTAVRTINWSITVANDVYFEYNTLLIPGASTTFVDDASTNNFAVTINGDTKPNSFNPYTPGYYSNYFDGTGDYLTTPDSSAFGLGTGDFTVELWAYCSFNSAIQALVDGRPSNIATPWALSITGTGVARTYDGTSVRTGGQLIANAWNHLVWARASNVNTIYVNGVVGHTWTASQDFGSTRPVTIAGLVGGGGEIFTGYLSNLRIVKGTAVYTSAFTPPTAPLTAISGTSLLTCQSNRFLDNSTNNFTLTVAGNTSISSFDPFVPNSSYSTYGSAYFDGTGDYLSLSQQTALSFGTGDFTVEAWVYPTANPASYWSIMDARGSATTVPWAAGLRLISGNLKLEFYTGTQIQGSITVPLNTWTHVAFSRSGTAFKGFVNGVVDINTTMSTNLNIAAGTQVIGAIVDPTYNTGYITDVRVVKGTAVYTTAFTPPSVPLTAIANTQLLTLQNNQSVNNSVFLDNSTNNFLVTRNGNTTQGTFSPYGGNWSNYFDGNGDYLNIPSATAAGSGSFCFEAWIYPTNSSVQQMILASATSGGFFVGMNVNSANKLGIGRTFIAIDNEVSYTWVNNQWYHIAVNKSGTSLQFFVNGVQVGSTVSNSVNYSVSGRQIGAEASGTSPFFGYISNARFVNASVYTSTFTPSTTPLTPITNTSLLTCQSNRLIDNSTNNYTITKNGDVSVQRFSPFNPSSVTATSYSGYFDGTGDYLTVPDNSAFDLSSVNFTFEVWVYPTSAFTTGTEQFLLDQWSASNYGYEFALITNGSSFTGLRFGYTQTGAGGNATIRDYTQAIPLNQWSHIAFVRNSGTTTAYYNGTSVGTSSDNVTIFNSTQTVHIGASPDGSINQLFYGYLSNMRLVKGTAVYTSNFTPSTTPLTAIANTSLLICQSPTFIDNSTNNFTISAFGNSQPTIQNPFGFISATTTGYTVSTIGGSGYFDGTDYLSLANNAAFQFGTGDFTVELYYYPTALTGAPANSQAIIGMWGGGTGQSSWLLYFASGNLYWYTSTNGSTQTATFNATSGMTINNWHHLALVRSSGTTTIYVNGTSIGSTGTVVNLYAASCTLTIGYNPTGGTPDYVYGYLSDIRIAKSTALYKANFVPPSAPLTAVQNTVLLNNMTSAGIYDAAMMNNMETVGDAKLSTAIAKFGGSSMSFDGSGDYLFSNSPTTDLYAFGTGDFTIEFWLYLNSTSSVQVFYDGRPASSQGLQPTIYMNSSGTLFYYTNGANRITGSSLSTNTWYHIAVSRSGSSTKMFVNGTQVGSTYTDSTNYVNSALRPMIGADGFNSGTPGGNSMNGYIDDLRITKGYARYTSNFTPPTIAFPVY